MVMLIMDEENTVTSDNSLIKSEDIKPLMKLTTGPTNLSETQEKQIEALKLVSGEEEIQQLKKILNREDKFLELSHNIWEDVIDRQDPLLNMTELRSLKGDIFVLYHLVVNNGIERMYFNYVNENHLTGIGEDDETNIKTELAWQYLEHYRQQNHEIDLGIENPIVVGMELEYTPNNARERLWQLYSNIYYKLAPNVYMGEPSNKLGFGEDYSPTPEDEENLQLLKQLTDLLGEGENRSPSELYWYSGINIRKGSVEKLHYSRNIPLNQVHEVKGKELITTPTLSSRAMLRDILIASKTGELGDEWNIHETISGITLNEEHTEIMDVLLMQAAAGFLPQDILDEAIESQVAEDNVGEVEFIELEVEDKFFKSSELRQTDTRPSRVIHYFPFHKVRGQNELKQYPSYNHDLSGVEIRDIMKYQTKDFPLLVRYTEFNEIAAWGIRAAQIPSDKRTREEESLATIYTNLRNQFWNLFEDNAIPIATPTDYYESFDYDPHNGTKYWEQLTRTHNYNRMLTEIILRSTYMDADFQTESRKIVTKFKREARKYIPRPR